MNSHTPVSVASHESALKTLDDAGCCGSTIALVTWYRTNPLSGIELKWRFDLAAVNPVPDYNQAAATHIGREHIAIIGVKLGHRLELLDDAVGICERHDLPPGGAASLDAGQLRLDIGLHLCGCGG